MRLWKKWLIGTLVLFLVLVAGAALFLSQVDPNSYRDRVSALVEGATGRKLVLRGDLRIELLPVPLLEANDITFANAPWASQPDMLRIKRLRADLGWLPLLKGRLEIRRFDVIEPEVFLETDAAGKGNWELGDEDAPVAENKTDTDAPSEALDIAVNTISIEKAGLGFLDGTSGDKIVLDMEELTIGSKRPGDRLTLSLRATYQDLPVTLDGRLGAVDAIRRNQPIEVDVKGSLGDAGFHVEGAVGKPLQAKEVRLDVGLKSPSTKTITDVAGVDVEELGPVAVQLRLVEESGHFHLDPVEASARPRGTEARISGSIRNVALDQLSGSAAPNTAGKAVNVNLQGNFGESRFSVAGDITGPLTAGGLRVDVAADTKSTQPLTKLAGIEFEELGPVTLSLTLLGQGGHFDFDNIELTARPRDTEVSMSGSVTNLVIDLDGAGTLPQPAKVDLEGTLGSARFTVAGDVAKPMQGKGLRLNVALETKSTRPFTDLAGVDVEEVGPLEAKLRVIEKDDRFDLEKIDISARPRDAQVTIKGSVRDILDNPLPDLDLALSAKNLRRLDQTLPNAGPVGLSAKLRSSGKVVELRKLVAKVGKSDLSGSATVDTGGKRPRAKATLRAKLIDLEELVPPDDKSDAGAVAEKPADGKVFSEDPLPLDVLKKFNADIDLAVNRLVAPKLTLGKVDVAAGLDNGNLTVRPTFEVAGGTLGAIINIDSRTQPTVFSADVDGKKVSIGTLTKQLRGYETSKGLDSNLKIKLRGQGDSVRALMAGLDGDIRLDIGEGRLNNEVLERVGADLVTQMISFAVPTDETDKSTAFECAVVRFAVEKGVAVADETLVMETDKVLLIGGGLIDLKTEDLDLGANLAARKGIRIGAGTLSSLVRVQGTLANPRIGTNLEGMAKTGARVGIAVATGGLSLIAESVYGQVSEDQNPCQTALDRKIDVTPREYKAKIEKGRME